MMRRFLPLALACMLPLAACAPADGSASQLASASAAAPCQPAPAPSVPALPGCLPDPSPAFTVGPGGSPIGEWSLTLVGGPAAGTYGGSDEMVCTGVAAGPMSVSFQPVGSPPIGQIDATTNAGDSSILVSAGGIESGASYQAATGQQFQTVVLGHATVQAGVALSLSISGTQQFPGEGSVRTMQLSVDCPLFPGE